ncbi:MAG: 2-oxo acid dehydrogenase subunit E2 [Candidatus Hydrogenedentes bacterium]|nr:2-oxo acid dehydrogenase subunit E2 [Candidatus Hydrogenedentota bacterium]
MAEFKLPELGENITTGTVTKVLVNVGDTVEKDQPVIELETEKAVVEVPCDVSGTVQEVRVKEGDTVKVGQVLLVVSAEAVKPEASKRGETPPARVEESGGVALPRDRAAVVESPLPSNVEEAETEEELAAGPEVRRAVLAAPSVRRLARELGVDLQQVKGAGPSGRISAADVQAYAQKRKQAKPPEPKPEQPQTVGEAVGSSSRSTAHERDRYGEFEREPMSGVRLKTLEHITKAWETIPHVTQFDSADITELERFRKEYGKRVEAAGGKLTMTVLLMKIVAEALKKFREFNSFVDVENNQILLKHYINIGIAVDTEYGLMVPVVRNADTKSLTQLAVEAGALAERARSRKVSIEDLQGGTFTITNLGGIGGLWFTPIIREPEVAILGVSRARMEPVWLENDFKPRLMLPMSLSYDHRVIDGADAVRFLRWLVEALEQPLRMVLD